MGEGGGTKYNITETIYEFNLISKYTTNAGKIYAMNTISQLTTVPQLNQNIVKYKTNNMRLQIIQLKELTFTLKVKELLLSLH